MNKKSENLVESAIQDALARIASVLRGLSLEELAAFAVGGGTTKAKAKAKAKPEPKPEPKKPRKPVSRRVARMRKLQGAYMGLLRQFKGKVRTQMVKLAKTDKSKAVAAMRKLRTAQAAKR